MDVEKGTLHRASMLDPNKDYTRVSTVTLQPYTQFSSRARRNLSKGKHIFSVLGYSLGYSNIFFFPPLCIKYGAAFIFSYIILLIFIGIPTLYMMMAIGQYSGHTLIPCFNFFPLFRFLGLLILIYGSIVSIYYAIYVSWCLYYFFGTFAKYMPWSVCSEPWSTKICRTKILPMTRESCTEEFVPFYNGTCYNTATEELYGIYNETIAKRFKIRTTPPEEEYYKYASIKHFVHTSALSMRMDIVTCAMIVWVCTFLFLKNSIGPTGKVYRVLSIFSIVSITVFFVKGIIENGYQNGLRLIFAGGSSLKNMTLWQESCVQMIFSLGVSSGIHMTLASYRRFEGSLLEIVVMTVIFDIAVSICCSIIVLCFLGDYAKMEDIQIEDIRLSGTGLIFVVFPGVFMSSKTFARFWAMLFFFTMFVLGIVSHSFIVDTAVNALSYTFDIEDPFRNSLVVQVCTAFFCFGLIMATTAGAVVIDYTIHVIQDLPFLIIIFVIFGLLLSGFMRFARDVQEMVGFKEYCYIPWAVLKFYFFTCWIFAIPLCMMVIMYTQLRLKKEILMSGSHELDKTRIEMFRTLVDLLPLLFVLFMILIDFNRTGPLNIREKIMLLFKPYPDVYQCQLGEYKKGILEEFKGAEDHLKNEFTFPGMRPPICSAVTGFNFISKQSPLEMSMAESAVDQSANPNLSESYFQTDMLPKEEVIPKEKEVTSEALKKLQPSHVSSFEPISKSSGEPDAKLEVEKESQQEKKKIQSSKSGSQKKRTTPSKKKLPSKKKSTIGKVTGSSTTSMKRKLKKKPIKKTSTKKRKKGRESVTSDDSFADVVFELVEVIEPSPSHQKTLKRTSTRTKRKSSLLNDFIDTSRGSIIKKGSLQRTSTQRTRLIDEINEHQKRYAKLQRTRSKGRSSQRQSSFAVDSEDDFCTSTNKSEKRKRASSRTNKMQKKSTSSPKPKVKKPKPQRKRSLYAIKRTLSRRESREILKAVEPKRPYSMRHPKKPTLKGLSSLKKTKSTKTSSDRKGKSQIKKEDVRQLKASKEDMPTGIVADSSPSSSETSVSDLSE